MILIQVEGSITVPFATNTRDKANHVQRVCIVNHSGLMYPGIPDLNGTDRLSIVRSPVKQNLNSTEEQQSGSGRIHTLFQNVTHAF